jgi:hypothetical protein
MGGAETCGRHLPAEVFAVDGHRSRWGLVVAQIAGGWTTPGVFVARRRCPATRSVRR